MYLDGLKIRAPRMLRLPSGAGSISSSTVHVAGMLTGAPCAGTACCGHCVAFDQRRVKGSCTWLLAVDAGAVGGPAIKAKACNKSRESEQGWEIESMLQ